MVPGGTTWGRSDSARDPEFGEVKKHPERNNSELFDNEHTDYIVNKLSIIF